MCGIAGLFGTNDVDPILLQKMAHSLSHRGPDNQQIWISDNLKIGLSHARLSIQDLSVSGNQPMVSQTERYVIVYNGEIYNHQKIRSKIDKKYSIKWVGNSDTETLLAAIEIFGLSYTLEVIKGMFAFGLFDKKLNKVFLVRDRFGEKPLYFGTVGDTFFFASELTPFYCIPMFEAEVDRKSLGLFLKYNSIPAPFSIFKNVWKVEPGQIVEVHVEKKSIKKFNYWSFESHKLSANLEAKAASFDETLDQLDRLLNEAVFSQLIGDVQIGSFLSGGVDSSLISAIAQKNSQNRLKTFSVGFDLAEYNEAKQAAEVAKHLGSEHHEIYISAKQALDIIPNLKNIYDEPFADSSQIPTYLISKFAREHVTVCLSGDAADELFGGYNRYLYADLFWKRISKIPSPFRNVASSILTKIAPGTYAKIGERFFGKNFGDIGDKIHKLVPYIQANDIDELYNLFISQISDVDSWMLNTKVINSGVDQSVKHEIFSSVEMMMIRDITGYLPTDILAKIDRAAMAVSLETRVPFLDLDLVKFCSTIPIDYKIKGKNNKHILRQLLYRYVPQKLVDRPKMGFGVPLSSWLRGPLREWAEHLLSEERLKSEGYFNVQFVREKWDEHLSGQRNWQHQLWNIIMFQSWLEGLNEQKRLSKQL